MVSFQEPEPQNVSFIKQNKKCETHRNIHELISHIIFWNDSTRIRFLISLIFFNQFIAKLKVDIHKINSARSTRASTQHSSQFSSFGGRDVYEHENSSWSGCKVIHNFMKILNLCRENCVYSVFAQPNGCDCKVCWDSLSLLLCHDAGNKWKALVLNSSSYFYLSSQFMNNPWASNDKKYQIFSIEMKKRKFEEKAKAAKFNQMRLTAKHSALFGCSVEKRFDESGKKLRTSMELHWNILLSNLLYNENAKLKKRSQAGIVKISSIFHFGVY